MKKTRVIVLCMLASLMISCEEFTTDMHYTFFSEDELSEICINKDSALSLQIAVSKLKTYDEFISSQDMYFEEDTICFISESGDTIRFRNYNCVSININYGLVNRTVAQSIAYSSITALDSCFMYSTLFRISAENSNNSKVIYRDFYYSRLINDNNNSIGSKFEPKDSSKINLLGIKYTYEPIMIMNQTLNNCFTVKQVDASSNEILKIVYSRKYGFLMIKDKTHVLTRIDI